MAPRRYSTDRQLAALLSDSLTITEFDFETGSKVKADKDKKNTKSSGSVRVETVDDDEEEHINVRVLKMNEDTVKGLIIQKARASSVRIRDDDTESVFQLLLTTVSNMPAIFRHVPSDDDDQCYKLAIKKSEFLCILRHQTDCALATHFAPILPSVKLVLNLYPGLSALSTIRRNICHFKKDNGSRNMSAYINKTFSYLYKGSVVNLVARIHRCQLTRSAYERTGKDKDFKNGKIERYITYIASDTSDLEKIEVELKTLFGRMDTAVYADLVDYDNTDPNFYRVILDFANESLAGDAAFN